jgi:hypothetical protein
MRVDVAGAVLALVLATGPALAQTTSTPGPMAPGPTSSFITVQPPNEWSAIVFLGDAVTNPAGETVGDINDLLFDKGGRINTAVIGVGGFLGVGEKDIAVPFNALSFSTGKDGERLVVVSLTKEALDRAPEYKPTEKTMFLKAKEKATEWGRTAGEKFEEMTKDSPTAK